jgi:geranylgeranyl pyrophosphate synthase
MIEEYEVLTEEDNLQLYFENVKPLIDNALRENLLTNTEAGVTFPHKPVFACLLILSTEICGGKPENVLKAAVSVELVNEGSQIFESKPAIAVSLLNAAYGVVFETKNISGERQIAAHRELVECIDANKINDLKNSNLIRLSMRIGAVLAGADYMQTNAVTRFADLLETALQLDKTTVFSDSQNLVKQAKLVLEDEFGITTQIRLLCDLADFITKEKA